MCKGLQLFLKILVPSKLRVVEYDIPSLLLSSAFWNTRQLYMTNSISIFLQGQHETAKDTTRPLV